MVVIVRIIRMVGPIEILMAMPMNHCCSALMQFVRAVRVITDRIAMRMPMLVGMTVAVLVLMRVHQIPVAMGMCVMMTMLMVVLVLVIGCVHRFVSPVN